MAALYYSTNVATHPGLRRDNPRLTLWSHISQESNELVNYRISDFQKIKYWSVKQHNEAHYSDLSWLRGEIRALRESTQEKRSVLVATHHAPSLQRTSSPQHAEIRGIVLLERICWSCLGMELRFGCLGIPIIRLSLGRGGLGL
ncbi:unnamed protein product [Penicillium roqueforti FM164]|uniref:Genomic scaffold, ProqFM164S01 n=1 Tax=Penicillium roqueforti (strain FM164) TaxID=1365484 RepID=W6Q5K8_PENRF|nr:unnamed protein product [Penicillium roqueforti FM164]